MSRTHKTKPFWVKLQQGHLDWVEQHNHADGTCDMPAPELGAEWVPGQRCRREFVYTGVRTCCCPMCHGNGGWDVRPGKRQRIERRKAEQNWHLEYETKDPEVDYWIGDNPSWYYGDGRKECA